VLQHDAFDLIHPLIRYEVCPDKCGRSTHKGGIFVSRDCSGYDAILSSSSPGCSSYRSPDFESKMTANALSSRLSPFSNSLFAPSPPTLPTTPTLAELQRHADGVAESVPKYTAMPKPISQFGSRVAPWYNGNTPPPSYEKDDPFNGIGIGRVKDGGNKLKKGKKAKKGWSKIGDEEGFRVQGGKSYGVE